MLYPGLQSTEHTHNKFSYYSSYLQSKTGLDSSYLWWRLGQFVCMHTIITWHKAAVSQVEEFIDSTMDFCLINPLLLHPGGVRIALVLIPGVNPPLARLYPPVDKTPDHRLSVQARPLNQVHSSSFCQEYSSRSVHLTLFSGTYPTSQNMALFGSSRM